MGSVFKIEHSTFFMSLEPSYFLHDSPQQKTPKAYDLFNAIHIRKTDEANSNGIGSTISW